MDTPLVSSHPEVMSGALCFAGTRVPVKNLSDDLEGSWTLEDFLEDFTSVSRARAVAVLETARAGLVQPMGMFPTSAAHTVAVRGR